MRASPFTEWHVDPEDFPRAGSDADKLRFLARYAILAPSSHNTQPWRFRIERDRLLLLADRSRRLPVVDPNDRELSISCGAALGVLRAAMRNFGHRGDFAFLPDSSDNDLFATVALGGPHSPMPEDQATFSAIPKRRSTRLAYAEEPLPGGLAQQLVRIAAADGVELKILEEPMAKAALAALVAEGDREQFADPNFRRELGSWVRSRRGRSRDGISGSSFGMPDVLSAVGGLMIRALDIGKSISAKDKENARRSPGLLIFATPTDQPLDWLRTGLGHVTVLLKIAKEGLTAAYLNPPLEVRRLRPLLASTARVDGVPQLLLRIGRGAPVTPAVRRPLSEVLIS